MNRVKIEVHRGDVYIVCPSCSLTESLPVDEPRHTLQAFDVMKIHDQEYLMKCSECNTVFSVDWSL